MKTLLLTLLLSTLIFAQSEFIIVLQGSGGNNRDSIPNNYTFTDSTDAVVSTEVISLPVVLLGYDSAYVNVTGGDYRIGALGDTTRLSTQIFSGDTLWAIDTSSATNGVTTNVALTIGGVVDTFSVTTEAASGVTPVFELVYNAGVTADANNKVTRWNNNVGDYDVIIYGTDTTASPLDKDSAIWWRTGYTNFLYADDSTSNPFDFGTNDLTIEVWIYQTGANTSTILDSYTSGQDGIRVALTATRFNFTLYSTAGVLGQIQTTDAPVTGAWKQYILRLDRNVGADLFVDSVWDASASEHDVEWTEDETEDINGTDEKTIGANDSGGAGALVDVYLKRIRIYHEALTDEQIQALFAEGKP